jgi:hypothetical protein
MQRRHDAFRLLGCLAVAGEAMNVEASCRVA